MPQLSHFCVHIFQVLGKNLKVIKIGNRVSVMLLYGSDYSPNLYAITVHKN